MQPATMEQAYQHQASQQTNQVHRKEQMQEALLRRVHTVQATSATPMEVSWQMQCETCLLVNKAGNKAAVVPGGGSRDGSVM